MQNDKVNKNLLQEIGFQDFIGQSPGLMKVLSQIPLIAETDATVLLIGETGVGKDVFAQAIHYLSKRKNKSFVPVNCGSLQATLIENELFGHKRGAFTDAREAQLGLLAEANGGTLFFDEVEALDLKAQSSLLRLLQNKAYRPLGQLKEVKADVRFVAATNIDLNRLVDEKSFRSDLLYRLGISITIPPLRTRKGDMPLLADFFLKQYAKQYNRPVKEISLDAMKRLMIYKWPGNIRELKKVIQKAVLLERNEYLQLEDFNYGKSGDYSSRILSYKEAKSCFEKKYLLDLVVSCSGNITMAANLAKEERRNFYRLLRKHKIDRDILTSV